MSQMIYDIILWRYYQFYLNSFLNHIANSGLVLIMNRFLNNTTAGLSPSNHNANWIGHFNQRNIILLVGRRKAKDKDTYIILQRAHRNCFKLHNDPSHSMKAITGIWLFNLCNFIQITGQLTFREQFQSCKNI